MEQCLQFALHFRIPVGDMNSIVRQLPDRRVEQMRLQYLWPFGNNPGEEVMLIGESGDVQAISLRAFGDARPIHMHRDVRVADSLKRRIQISMLRADLNACMKFIAQISVIDREDVAASASFAATFSIQSSAA